MGRNDIKALRLQSKEKISRRVKLMYRFIFLILY